MRNVDSLVSMYPRYYLTYDDPVPVGELEIGQRASVFVRISSEINIRYVKRMKIVTCLGKDGTGTISLTWFNMPYLTKTAAPGKRLCVYRNAGV